MPRPFIRLSAADFVARLAETTFHRRIDMVHLHHTWRPDHQIWGGFKTRGDERLVIDGMWRFHTTPKPKGNGWGDIAQHVSVDPDGGIWTGRDWSAPPASAVGFNGNAAAGPFMIEMIGDFDDGRDQLGGAQLGATLTVIAAVQLAFGLPHDAVRFHNQMTNAKSCPGGTTSREAIIAAVRDERARLDGQVERARVEPRPAGAARSRDAALLDETLGGELPEEETEQDSVFRYFSSSQAAGGDGGDARAPLGRAGRALSADEVSALRPHVINLTDGRFGPGGEYETTEQDVDAIFDEHIPQWLSAGSQRDPLRIVVWAHGGLVAERSGLAIARKHIDWWKANGVYPIYFVWETGLFDALRSVLESVARRIPGLGRRDFADRFTDPLVEAGSRALGGTKIWRAMKDDAATASGAGGGATYVATALARFLAGPPGRDVSLHAVGHSAGSIFHAHFLPALHALGVREIDTVQLLAPAVRVDSFKRRLMPMVGQAVKALTVYTMQRSFEEADDCMRVYRKSLLYLVHHALEPERRAPILGLELSLRGDPELRALFGFGGRAPVARDAARVVWSVSEASASRTHGGFDDDAPTMNSVAARVLDAAAPRVPYRADAARAAAGWPTSDDWLDGFDLSAAAAAPADTSSPADAPSPAAGANGAGRAPARPGGRGARRALCIGIDHYPASPLHGCVADSTSWAEYLRRDRSFTQIQQLRNGDATREAILSGARELVAGARRGDVIVFQFAGHGTQLRDDDGDETDGHDEAFVPVDYEEGAFLVDDDIRAVFADLREGVNLTCFIDCCHSGTITRILARNGDPRHGGRPRFLRVTESDERAHRRFRANVAERGRGARAAASGPTLRWVTLSACQPTEVAFENDGQGDFTRNALAVLRERGGAGLSHREFQRRVTEAFGASRRQSPFLDCPPHAQDALLLEPRGVDAGGAGPELRDPPDGAVPGALADTVRGAARTLAGVADALDR